MNWYAVTVSVPIMVSYLLWQWMQLLFSKIMSSCGFYVVTPSSSKSKWSQNPDKMSHTSLSHQFLIREAPISLTAKQKMSTKSATRLADIEEKVQLPPTSIVNFEPSLPCSIFKSEAYHLSIPSPWSMIQTYLFTCNITSLLTRLWS